MIVLNHENIKDIIPHRGDMLLVDKITILDSGSLIGEYKIRGTEYFLSGHFPSNPIVPGVILCEMAAQSCCGFAYVHNKKLLPYLVCMDKIKFKRLVIPGDNVAFNCCLISNRRSIVRIKCEGKVNDKQVLIGQMTFLLSDINRGEIS